MTQKSSSKNAQVAYEPVRVTVGPDCRTEAFPPCREAGATLFEAGIKGTGVNRLDGYFWGGTDCSETHLLHATISGCLEDRSRGKPLSIGRGEMLVAPARGPHHLRLEESPTTVVWFHLRQTRRWEFLFSADRHVRKLLNPTMLLQTAEAILYCARDEDPYAAKLMPYYSEILLICLTRELDMLLDPVARAVQQRLLRLWDDVREHPAYPWSVSELGRRAGMAAHYLVAVCKRHTGVTPMRKVTMIRMETAQHLLLATDLPLADIGARVGYTTEYAFSDAFKRVSGSRPGAVRRQH